ncbi:MAG TPA: YihY/virulence factor BrkB family protein [Bryobacteraceae bacterium]|nr:YihY/virulence factor BrkB family protein [Bryobacteraceae bacterium]
MPKAAGQFASHLARLGRLQKRWWVFRRAVVSAYKDNCLGTAKGAAYSALLAFFPVLTSLTAILVQANAASVSKILSNLVFEVVPPGTEEIVLYNFTARGQRPVSLLVVATLLSIWAASGVMISLIQGFRAAYRIPTGRPFLKERATAILLVFSAALPVIGASTLMVLGARTEKYVLTWTGVMPEGQQWKGWILLVGQLLRYGVALAAIVLGVSLLYYFGPNHPRRLRNVWPGAIIATCLWWAATAIFSWYVRNIANYNVLYGSIGAVIALLVWMYLLSVIALIGCEYNAERERLMAEGMLD